MAKLSPLLAEWGTMKFLITEMALCLVAASILGLIIGWLCKAAFARDKLLARERAWQNKFHENEQEHKARIESAQQETRVLSSRVEALDARNKTLDSSLDTNKSAVHKAHIEVQRLSNKQKETHTRLEKIIAEKDREITNLVKASNHGKDTVPRPYGFSSNKPPEAKPAKPPSPARNSSRKAPAAVPAPRAGGTPGPSQRDTDDFKPGTQRSLDDSDIFDRTQVLDQGNDRMIETGLYTTDNSTYSQKPDASGSLPKQSFDDPATTPGQARDERVTSAHSERSQGASTASNQPSKNVTGKQSENATSKPRKRSLWERVKGSGKKDT